MTTASELFDLGRIAFDENEPPDRRIIAVAEQLARMIRAEEVKGTDWDAIRLLAMMPVILRSAAGDVAELRQKAKP